MAALFAAGAAAVGVLAGVDPPVAVAAGLGMGFVLLVVSDLAVGLCVFVVVSFLDVLPAGGAALSSSKVVGLLLALSWLATSTTQRGKVNDFVSDHPGMTFGLLAFLVWNLVSLLWAEDPGAGARPLYRLALVVVLFLIVYAAVRTRQQAVWVLGAFVVGAVLSAVYGILSPSPADVSEPDRLGGAGVDPNELAGLLVAGLSLAAAFVTGWRGSSGVRLLATLAVGLCVVGVLMSLSRGGLVAMSVALLAAVAIGGRWRSRSAVLLGTVAAVGICFFAFVASPAQRERVLRSDGGTGRSDIWDVGWRMVEADPLQGVGSGNFRVSSIHFLLEPGVIRRDEFIVDRPMVAHNMYLEVLAELGAVGLALFTTIVAFGLVSALRAARAFERAGDRRLEALARALAVAIVALLVSDFFLSEQYSKQLWVLLALGPTLERLAIAELRSAGDLADATRPMRLRPAWPAPGHA